MGHDRIDRGEEERMPNPLIKRAWHTGNRDGGLASMRKIIVFNAISLGGYHTGPDNEVSVIFPMMETCVPTIVVSDTLAATWPYVSIPRP